MRRVLLTWYTSSLHLQINLHSRLPLFYFSFLLFFQCGDIMIYHYYMCHPSLAIWSDISCTSGYVSQKVLSVPDLLGQWSVKEVITEFFLLNSQMLLSYFWKYRMKKRASNKLQLIPVQSFLDMQSLFYSWKGWICGQWLEKGIRRATCVGTYCWATRILFLSSKTLFMYCVCCLDVSWSCTFCFLMLNCCHIYCDRELSVMLEMERM